MWVSECECLRSTVVGMGVGVGVGMGMGMGMGMGGCRFRSGMMWIRVWLGVGLGVV